MANFIAWDDRRGQGRVVTTVVENLAEYIETLWAEGDPKRQAYDAVCGVQHLNRI